MSKRCTNSSDVEGGHTAIGPAAKSVQDLLAQARSEIPAVSVDEAKAWRDAADVSFVDVREWHELQQTGIIPGAVHCARSSLEWALDPAESSFNPVFAGHRRLVFVCGSGGRAALSARVAASMSGCRVWFLQGGFRAWAAAGLPVQAWPPGSAS